MNGSFLYRLKHPIIQWKGQHRWHHVELGDNPSIDLLWNWWLNNLQQILQKYYQYENSRAKVPATRPSYLKKQKDVAIFQNEIRGKQYLEIYELVKIFAIKLTTYRRK